jgi:L-gulono-1,4-lactone dehydrogenase
LRLYWFANTDVIQVMAMNRTQKPRTAVNRVADFFREVVLRTELLHLLQETGWLLPGLVGPINRFSAAVGWQREERVDRSDKILTITMPPRHEETEYAIPVDETARVLQRLPDLIEKADYKVNLPIEIRFVAADQNLLSPAYGRPSCYVGAYTFGEKFAIPLFDGFEPFMKQLGGRPHWGKHLTLTAEEVRAMYPEYDRFIQFRRELDLHQVFTNAFVRQLFT